MFSTKQVEENTTSGLQVRMDLSFGHKSDTPSAKIKSKDNHRTLKYDTYGWPISATVM